MKKILTFIILMIPMINVNAETKWSDWQNEKPTGENIIIEMEERYKWYKITEEVTYTNLENEHNCEYFDKNDYILSDWIISYDTPKHNEYRTIKYKEINQNRDVNLIGTLHIFDISSDKIINITEISISKNSKNIQYTLTDKTDFKIKEFNKLNDNDLEEIAIDFENHDKVSLTFENLISIDDMSIKISYKNENIKIDKIGIATSHDIYNYITYQNIYNDIFDVQCNETICELIINIRDINFQQFPELPIIVYEYQDKLFKCTNIRKEYLNGYYVDVNDYIKDENSQTIFYRYKVREINTLNNSKELVYKKEDNISENLNNETIISNPPSTYSPLVENDNKGNNNYIYIISFLIILSIISIIIFIIKKYVNKNRTK